jgi:hypothetical protein
MHKRSLEALANRGLLRWLSKNTGPGIPYALTAAGERRAVGCSGRERRSDVFHARVCGIRARKCKCGNVQFATVPSRKPRRRQDGRCADIPCICERPPEDASLAELKSLDHWIGNLLRRVPIAQDFFHRLDDAEQAEFETWICDIQNDARGKGGGG